MRPSTRTLRLPRLLASKLEYWGWATAVSRSGERPAILARDLANPQYVEYEYGERSADASTPSTGTVWFPRCQNLLAPRILAVSVSAVNTGDHVIGRVRAWRACPHPRVGLEGHGGSTRKPHN